MCESIAVRDRRGYGAEKGKGSKGEGGAWHLEAGQPLERSAEEGGPPIKASSLQRLARLASSAHR